MQQSYLYFLSIFFFFLIDNQLVAQVDTLLLPEVELTVPPTNIQSQAGKHTRFDSIVYLENSYAHIGNLLSEQAGLQVQNYGPGQLASVRIRGMSASHTQLYWQDIPLNSNMLGQVDFSLIPTTLFSDISLSHGASGSSRGTGSLGGNVMLDTDILFSSEKKNAIKAGQQLSDMGSSTTFLNLHYLDKKKAGQTKLLSINSLNSFRYKNHIKIGKPVERAKNAGFHQHHLMQSFAFRANKVTSIRSHIWASDSYRNLSFSKATQQDRALRAVSTLEGKNYDFTVAYIDEILNYTNESIGLYSDSRSQRIYAKASIRQSIHSIAHESGLSMTYDNARAAGYPTGKNQWFANIFTDNQLTFKLLHLNILLREEWREGKFSPFLYTINIRPRHLLPFKLELTHSRNIHYPTFNDRHWQPGGNPDLQAEKAYHWEVNMERSMLPDYTSERNYFSIKTNLTLYHTRLSNSIQWQPTDAGYWAAFNIKNVHSTGIEASVPIRYVMNDLAISWTNMYALTHTIDKTINTENYDKQLPYVPRHKWNSTLRMNHIEQAWSWRYKHGLTGARFVSSDNSTGLPMYQTGSLSGSYDLAINNKINLRFDLTINNLWNIDYEIVQGYPMPLRYIELGIVLSNL